MWTFAKAVWTGIVSDHAHNVPWHESLVALFS